MTKMLASVPSENNGWWHGAWNSNDKYTADINSVQRMKSRQAVLGRCATSRSRKQWLLILRLWHLHNRSKCWQSSRCRFFDAASVLSMSRIGSLCCVVPFWRYYKREIVWLTTLALWSECQQLHLDLATLCCTAVNRLYLGFRLPSIATRPGIHEAADSRQLQPTLLTLPCTSMLSLLQT